MFRRILVPLDGSDRSESILPHVPLVRHAEAEVTLLHVLSPMPVPVGAPPFRILALPEEVERYLQELRPRLEGARFRTLVRAGDPADAIAAAAEEVGADLIAMATQGRTGLARLLFGSVAQAVIRARPVTMLVARPGTAWRRPPPRRILVPIGSEEFSRGILPQAELLARESGARLYVCHVRRQPVIASSPVGPLGMPPIPAIAHPVEPDVEEIASGLRTHGVDAWAVVDDGDPASRIVHQAKEQDADLVIMMTSGRTGLRRFLLGSVADGVMATIDRPLLLARSP